LEVLRRTENPLKRRLLLVGILTKELEKKGIRPILVGGNALELYTLGGYSTADVDLVCSDRKLAGEILEKLGFKKFGRFWINEDLEMIVEFPDTKLAGSTERVEEFEVDGLRIYVIGKEDLIVDRLNACVFWKSKDDCRWVKELILLYYDKIDWNYLKMRCEEEGTIDELVRIRREVEEIMNEVGRFDKGEEEDDMDQMLSKERTKKQTDRSR